VPTVKHIDGPAVVAPSDPMVTAGNIPGSFLDLVSFLSSRSCPERLSARTVSQISWTPGFGFLPHEPQAVEHDEQCAFLVADTADGRTDCRK